MAKKVTLEVLDTKLDKQTKAIGGLTEFVAAAFQKVADRFDRVDERSNNIEGEIRETRETLARAIKDLDLRFVAWVGHNREEVDRLKAWMEDIDARLSALEEKRGRKTS